MPAGCYGQLRDHAHNGGTSLKMFTIHNIISTITIRLSWQKFHAKGLKVSSKDTHA
jgi:hypothetical protein